jgi:ribulose-phosphate 3-epimerase
MVEKNDWFIEEIARIGAEQVSVHAESAVHLDRSLALIRSHGLRAGVALNPATPLSALDYVVDRLDVVLIMTVNPGFAGQKLVPATLAKIADCRVYLDRRGSDALIEVDGNVSFENIPGMVAAGADILVAGTSSLYPKGASMQDNMDRLRAGVRDGLDRRAPRAGRAGESAPADAVRGVQP